MAKKIVEKTLTDLYFDFIESLDKVGSTANNELSHSDFTDDNEQVAKESIAYFDLQLSALAEQINGIKAKAKETFGW